MKSELSQPHASALPARDWRAGERAWRRWAHGGHDLWSIIRSAAVGWMNHGAMEMAAAISYYAAFSLAPLLVIAVAIAGLVVDSAAAREQVVNQFQGMMGKEGGQLVATMLENAGKPKQGSIAAAIGIVVLLVGASGAFSQLKEALNRTWEVREAPSGTLWRFLRTRVFSFAMVLVIAFLLLLSLAISAVLSGVGAWATGALPGWAAILQMLDFVVSLTFITVLIAVIYRFLPDARIGWREVWIGAALTAGLFTLGKYLIGLYLGQSSPASVYGAAGSLAIILLWVYYSSLIFLFGAEVTRAHAQHLGKPLAPRGTAERREMAGPGSGRRGGGETASS